MCIRDSTTRGRVVAAMSDAYAPEPGAASGAEWLPEQPAPSRVIRLAGIPAEAGEQTLLIANPSDLEALVDVEVAGKSGSFAPEGLTQVRVPPGAVEATDITNVLGKEPVALRLRSGVPVVASVRSLTHGDSSYAGPVMPLGGSAVAPVIGGAKTTVQLTAGDLAARATADPPR